MQIFINGKFLSQKASGVQKYALGLSTRLQQIEPSILVLIPQGLKYEGSLKTQAVGFLRGNLWEQIDLLIFLRKQKDYLLMNFCNSAPLFSHSQFVCIHDLAFEKNEKWFSAGFKLWYRFLIPKLAKSSRRILTVSGFIKNEIIDKYHIDPQKISIIPNGTDIPDIADPPLIPGKYILLTAIHNPRKNAKMVFDALPVIIGLGYQLVTTGNPERAFRNFRPENTEGVVHLGFVNEPSYYNLLKYSGVLLYPSHYEGFGIPLLEAFLSDVKVIASNLPVFKESFEELPIYFTGSDELKQALDKLPGHRLPEEAINALRKKFNFEASAKHLLQLIRDFEGEL